MRSGSAWSVVLCIAALTIAIGQQSAGIRVIGAGAAHDAAFALLAVRDYRDALSHGVWLPRWISIANGGLGAPVFYFYPPGAFLFTSVLSLSLPTLSPIDVIQTAETIFRVAGGLFCVIWLRRHVDRWPAIAGGALYALMPYVAVVNPQIRMAFAETAAGALLPLVFLAADLGQGRLVRTLCFVAPAIGAMLLTHLPASVLAGVAVVLYGLCSGVTLGDAMRRAAVTAAAAVLGAGLAAVTLLPALLLQRTVQFDTLNGAFFRTENNVLFTPASLQHGWLLVNLMLHAGVLVPLAAGIAAFIFARRNGVAKARPLALTLFILAALVTPLGWPVWRYMPALDRIQFPFRLSLPISLLGAASLALVLPRMEVRWARLTQTGALVMAGLLLALAVDLGDRRQSGAMRSEQGLSFAEPAEYLPSSARAVDWESARKASARAIQTEGEQRSGCAGSKPSLQREPNRLVVLLHGCTGPTVLPHFYYPGWEPAPGAPPVQLDSATGLMRIEAPAQTPSLSYERRRLPEETLGWSVSGAALLIWLGLVLFQARRQT